ncbi:hypothetical protein [Clostridium sp.]|nr:hypothetical protein [Clostridium sp.]
MEIKREEATVEEIIGVISEIILKASIKKFNDKDVEERCPK